MEEKYQIKSVVFEGPLDLLLNLIEKRKLSITDISLAKITDDYIFYIKNIENFSIKNSINFILIASTLMLIKSKSLLPALDLTLEEEQSINNLGERLIIYRRIRDLSIHISGMFGRDIIFGKNIVKSTDIVFSPNEKITSENMFALAVEMITKLPKKEEIPKRVVKKNVSLEEMIDKLINRIKSNIKMSFKDFSGMGKEEKINIVVSFLAMLELVKQGVVNVNQRNNFGDIDIENEDIDVPYYS